MTKIDLKIKNLQVLLETDVDENRLVNQGESLLNDLRQSWLSQKSAFTDNDISLLCAIKDTLESISNFIDLQEEAEYVATSDDANQIIYDLFIIHEQTEGLKIQQRIHKEIRELHEISRTLPSDNECKESSKRNIEIAKLNSNAPRCNKCGSSFIIREGGGTYFWSCERFPDCWGKRWLTKSESNKIFG